MKLQQVLIFLCLAVIFVSVNSDSVAFVNIGMMQTNNANNQFYKKAYYLPRYFRTHNWFEAASVCRTFNMSLATFDSLTEFQAVQNFLKQKFYLISTNYVFIGGVANTAPKPNDWYWAATNKKVPFAMPWDANQPDFSNMDEWCLALGSKANNNMLFNDVNCYTPQTFLCDLRGPF